MKAPVVATHQQVAAAAARREKLREEEEARRRLLTDDPVCVCGCCTATTFRPDCRCAICFRRQSLKTPWGALIGFGVFIVVVMAIIIHMIVTIWNTDGWAGLVSVLAVMMVYTALKLKLN